MPNTNLEMNWYVVYTRANYELYVSKALTEKRIINYCPLNRLSSPAKYSKRKYDVPLLRSYVFVKVFESQLKQLRLITGIINYLNNIDKPAIVSEFEIGLLRNFANDHINLKVGKTKLDVESNSPVKNSSKKQSNIQTIELPSLGCKITGEYAPSLQRLNTKEFTPFPPLTLDILRNYIRQKS